MLLNVVFLPVLFLVTIIIRHYFAVELDAVIYMPNRHFFISKDNKFWVTNEGGGFKREGFVNKICSRLTRVDIAAWWGVDKDETSCAKKPPFEGDSWLLLEVSSVLLKKRIKNSSVNCKSLQITIDEFFLIFHYKYLSTLQSL